MDFETLAQQHVDLLKEIDKLWQVFVALVFVGIVFMAVSAGLAIWSVRQVTHQHQIEFNAILKLLAKVLRTDG